MKIKSRGIVLPIVISVTMLSLIGMNVSQASVNAKSAKSFVQATPSKTPCKDSVVKNVNATLRQETLAQQKIIIAERTKFVKTVSEAACLKTFTESSLLATVADATAIGQEIASNVSDYTSFGTSSGSISLVNFNKKSSKGTLAFSKMNKATGSGTSTASGPGVTMSTIRISRNSILSSGNYGSGDGLNFCIVVTQQDKVVGKVYAKYTSDEGTESTKTQVNGTPLTCIDGA